MIIFLSIIKFNCQLRIARTTSMFFFLYFQVKVKPLNWTFKPSYSTKRPKLTFITVGVYVLQASLRTSDLWSSLWVSPQQTNHQPAIWGMMGIYSPQLQLPTAWGRGVVGVCRSHCDVLFSVVSWNAKKAAHVTRGEAEFFLNKTICGCWRRTHPVRCSDVLPHPVTHACDWQSVFVFVFVFQGCSDALNTFFAEQTLLLGARSVASFCF